MKILEQIGTGMNFAAKQEIINSVLSSTADEILICVSYFVDIDIMS